MERISDAERSQFLFIGEQIERLEIQWRLLLKERDQLIRSFRISYGLSDGDSFDKQTGIITKKRILDGDFNENSNSNI